MYGYDQLFDVIALANLQMRAEHWLLTNVLVWSSLLQITASAVGGLLSVIVARPLAKRIRAYVSSRRMTDRLARNLGNLGVRLAFPGVALGIFAAFLAIFAALDLPYLLLETVINLLAVWIVIRLSAVVIRNDTLANLLAVFAFVVATLNILDLLQPTLVLLEGVGVRIGSTYISVLDALRGAIELTVLVWLAITVSRLLEQRIYRAGPLTPSLQVLTSKMTKFALVGGALLIGLSGFGIDLTALAVFSGALGVGIGFGLQKPIANLISGVILLLDRSIKPGDVIELGDPSMNAGQRFGWVTALNARYASLTTRDGTEWLIPNEDLITQRVVNWSFQHNRLRLLTPYGVSFDSDVRMAIELAVEAALETPRVLKDPPPVCRLMGFGDSTANLELRIWIEDPKNGIINVRSDVLVRMWEKYRDNGIRTPSGHRDISIRDGSELGIVTRPHPTSGDDEPGTTRSPTLSRDAASG